MTQKGALHIPSLDGFRGASVLLVLGSHVLHAARVPDFIPGSFGVTVFFFLSGYLITTLLRLEHESTGRISFARFYLRRTLRICPPFYLVLMLASICGAYSLSMRSSHMDWTYVLGQALHLTNFQQIYFHPERLAPGTDIFWSLAVEEHFYLLFPLLFVWLVRVKDPWKRAQILLSMCAAVLLWRCYLEFALHAPYDRTYRATDTRIDSILFGCALALWGNPSLDRTRIAENVWKYWLLPGAVAGLLLSFSIRSLWFLDTLRYTLQGVCLFAVFVVAVRYPTWAPMRPFNSRALAWIGLISYSLYLTHLSVLNIIHFVWRPPLWVLAPAVLGVSIALSAAMYYGIELPAARLRKRLSSLPGQATLAGQVTPSGQAALSGQVAFPRQAGLPVQPIPVAGDAGVLAPAGSSSSA